MTNQISEQTRLELERGRIIAERARRSSELLRFKVGGKLKWDVALEGHPLYEPKGQVNLFIVDDVQVAHQNVMDDDYPSEAVYATVVMAINATVGTEGVPGPDYELSDEEKDAAARRNAYRDQYLGQWRDAFDNNNRDGNKGPKP